MSWEPLRKALAVTAPVVTFVESIDSIVGIGGPAADTTLKVIGAMLTSLQQSLASGEDPVTTGAAIAEIAAQHIAAFEVDQAQRNQAADQALAEKFKGTTP